MKLRKAKPSRMARPEAGGNGRALRSATGREDQPAPKPAMVENQRRSWKRIAEDEILAGDGQGEEQVRQPRSSPV